MAIRPVTERHNIPAPRSPDPWAGSLSQMLNGALQEYGQAINELIDRGATWGGISGTLSNQTDLQNALNGKVPTSRTLTGGHGINSIGNLSANRTISVDDTADYNWTGSHTWSKTLFGKSGHIECWGDSNTGSHYWFRDANGNERGVLYAPPAATSETIRLRRKNAAGSVLGNFTFGSEFTTDVPIHANGELIASSASLQVNGFMRTGNIYIHEGGNTPTTSDGILSNLSGVLEWNDNPVITGVTNVWQQSSDGNDRIYFNDGGHTYIRAAGTGGVRLRNSSNVDILYAYDNGNVVVPNGYIQGNGLNADSDIRLKKNWKPITDPWSVLDPMGNAVGEYDWIKDGRHDSGFNAQKVREIAPHLIHESEDDGYLSMSQISVIPYLVAAVNDLRQQVKELSRGGH